MSEWMMRRDGVGEPHERNTACSENGCEPVVVISPEDRGAVERLMADMWKRGRKPWEHTSEGVRVRLVDALTDALREFANPTPPKPDEPLGLGAVVEDADEKWVRLDTNGAGWYVSDRAGSARCWADFSLSVCVLSEGVS